VRRTSDEMNDITHLSCSQTCVAVYSVSRRLSFLSIYFTYTMYTKFFLFIAVIMVMSTVVPSVASASCQQVYTCTEMWVDWGYCPPDECDTRGGFSCGQQLNDCASFSDQYACDATVLCEWVNDTPQSSPAPTLTFTAADNDVLWGTDTTLSWASTDATSCVASGDWSGDRPTSGSSITGNIWSEKVYTLDCAGPGGTVSKSVTVTWHVFPQETTDQVPVGVLDSASCSMISGWAYDPDTTPTNTVTQPPTNQPPTSSTACWQTPSATIIDGYTRCQQSGACTAGGVTNSKCLDANGNMEQPSGSDYCIAVSDLNNPDCNRPVPYTPTTLSCTVSINEPADALGISGMNGGSRVIGQQASADFACQQLGYSHATYFATRGFKSCGDNGLAYVQNGGWRYGNACDLGNSGIYYMQCQGTGSICQNKCGNGVIDSGEQCDGNSSLSENRCGEPSWYCTNSCLIRTNNVDSRAQCP